MYVDLLTGFLVTILIVRTVCVGMVTVDLLRTAIVSTMCLHGYCCGCSTVCVGMVASTMITPMRWNRPKWLLKNHCTQFFSINTKSLWIFESIHCVRYVPIVLYKVVRSSVAESNPVRAPN